MSILKFRKRIFYQFRHFSHPIEINQRNPSLLKNTLGELAAGQEGKALPTRQCYLAIIQIRLIVRIGQVKETIRVQIILIRFLILIIRNTKRVQT